MILVGFSLITVGIYAQVSPRTGKRLDAETKKIAQGTRKVPRLRATRGWKRKGWVFVEVAAKDAPGSSDGCFFFVWGICHSSHPSQTVGFFKKKNDMSAFETREKSPKVDQLCWPTLNHCCFVSPGLLGVFFPPWLSSTPWVWPVTPLTRGRRSTSDFWSFTSGSCQENVDLGGEKCGEKIPWGDDRVSQFGFMDTIQVHNICGTTIYRFYIDKFVFVYICFLIMICGIHYTIFFKVVRFSICVSQGTFPHSSRLSRVETSPGASGFGRGNGAEKCQGLAGTNGFFGAVKA